MKIVMLGLIGLILGAILGGVIGVGLGFAWTTVFHTSSFEGYSGMLVFFTFMPIGIIAGALTGAIRRAISRPAIARLDDASCRSGRRSGLARRTAACRKPVQDDAGCYSDCQHDQGNKWTIPEPSDGDHCRASDEGERRAR